MGMQPAVARADGLLARLEEGARPGPGRSTARPLRAALRREQDVWLVEYGGRNICLHDAKGLHHLATLFEQPGTGIAAIALAGATAGGPDHREAALVAHRVRAQDLREELAVAQAFNDPERVARARRQIELLAADVERTGGATSAATERARVNVTRAIKAAVGRIADQEPDLGHLLRSTVRTGTTCRYEPDPGVPLKWEVFR
jgi:hypothetical protein